MNRFTTKFAASLMLVALGGVAGFALNADHGGAATEAQQRPPVIVRTQVIKRTVRIHRKPSPPKQPPKAPRQPVSAAGVRASAAVTPQPVVAARPAVQAPIRTRTSGASGRGEHESESESESESHDD